MSVVFSSAGNSTNLPLQLFPYDDLKDVRTARWPLVDSFWHMAALVGVYLWLVRYLPKWTQRHKPLQIKGLLIIYNLFMALLNAHICLELYVAAARLKYNYACQPCLVIHSSNELKIAAAIWWFYFSKLLEFSDTIFFILRKKWAQLSFLHVYHHSTMFPLWWIAVKWVPTGSTFFPAMINSFVHVVMYGYYALSALGVPTKYLRWKQYLTILQLAQFTIGLLWAVQALARGCDFPKWICCATIVYMCSFLLLFGRFYVCKYHQRQRRQQRQQLLQQKLNKLN